MQRPATIPLQYKGGRSMPSPCMQVAPLGIECVGVGCTVNEEQNQYAQFRGLFVVIVV